MKHFSVKFKAGGHLVKAIVAARNIVKACRMMEPCILKFWTVATAPPAFGFFAANKLIPNYVYIFAREKHEKITIGINHRRFGKRGDTHEKGKHTKDIC